MFNFRLIQPWIGLTLTFCSVTQEAQVPKCYYLRQWWKWTKIDIGQAWLTNMRHLLDRWSDDDARCTVAVKRIRNVSIFAPQIKKRAANRLRFSELVPLYPMASQGGDSDLLETLYPVPLSTGITPFPGHSSESARALLSVLKHNYQTHHNFFNDKGYHKYV